MSRAQSAIDLLRSARSGCVNRRIDRHSQRGRFGNICSWLYNAGVSNENKSYCKFVCVSRSAQSASVVEYTHLRFAAIEIESVCIPHGQLCIH